MLITQEINYKNKIIKVTELTHGSKQIIQAQCDFCSNVVEIEYCFYYKRTKAETIKFACCKKCAAIRTKEILMEKYGVSNIAQVPEVKSKISETNLEKYGSESYFGTSDAKEKSKKTILEKYGTDNYTKTEKYIEKVKKTNLEKWGTEWYLSTNDKKIKSAATSLIKYGTEAPSQSDEIKSKIVKTNIDKYGFASPLLNEEIKLKSKKTLKENWGVDNPLKSSVIREKVKKTNLKKRGHFYPTQSIDVIQTRRRNNLEKFGTENINPNEEFRKNNFKIANHSNYLKYLGNSISIFKCDNCKIDFQIHTDNFFRRLEQELDLCTSCNPIGDLKSIKEKDLFEFIKSIYDGDIIQSYRDKLEIDIYLPEINLGFEFNGLYWHSEKYLDRNYHINKLKYFKSEGIRILNIWEDDWMFKNDIIKSMISNLFKNNKKIFARNCEVREIKDISLVREFLEKNHIQGWVNSKVKIGLYHKNEIVSLMTFDQAEGRKKMKKNECNLSRFCSKLNYSIVGGASKLLSYFITTHKPQRIISYADKDWSTGELYIKLGFNLLSESNPDYKYIDLGVRKHKSNFKINESKVNLLKIWDCGKLKYEKILN